MLRKTFSPGVKKFMFWVVAVPVTSRELFMSPLQLYPETAYPTRMLEEVCSFLTPGLHFGPTSTQEQQELSMPFFTVKRTFFLSFILWHWGFELRTSHLLGRWSYCLSHSASPFLCFFFFKDGVLRTICLGVASICDPPDFCLLNSEDYRHEPLAPHCQKAFNVTSHSGVTVLS
jgi:hypothetical protein